MQHPGSAWTAAAVTAALDSGRRAAGIAAPLAPKTDWSTVVEAITLHRVHGLLGPHVSQLGMPDEYAARVSAAHRRMLNNGIAEVRDTDVVSQVLHGAGIDHLVVKGVVLGAAVGEMPALRGGGDIDVWVRERQVAEGGVSGAAPRLAPPADR